jgi:hypothetical protein
MPAKKPKPEEKPQRERFIEAAREVGADETEEGFDRAFSMVIAEKPHRDTNPK